MTIISNSIIIPPRFTKALIKTKDTTAKMAFDVIHDVVSIQEEEEKKCWKQINNILEDENQTDEIEDDNQSKTNEQPKSLNNNFFLEAKIILEHLQKWSSVEKWE